MPEERLWSCCRHSCRCSVRKTSGSTLCSRPTGLKIALFLSLKLSLTVRFLLRFFVLLDFNFWTSFLFLLLLSTFPLPPFFACPPLSCASSVALTLCSFPSLIGSMFG